jgi:integrase
MGRRGHVWYCRSRGQYRITNPMTGKQVPLSPRGTPESPANEAAARAAWEQLQNAAPPAATAPTAGVTTAGAVDAYLAWADRRLRLGKLSPGCLQNYRQALGPLREAFGPRPISGIIPEELEDWAALPRRVHGRPQDPPRPWSPSTQHNYLGVVLQVFKKTKCPISLDRPHKESRGAAVVLSDEQFALVLDSVGTSRRAGDLAALLWVLRETGARPGEVTGLTPDTVDWPNALVRLTVHKTRKQTGRDRVIILNPAALAVLAGQKEKYGRGLLFRNRDGRAYTSHEVARRLERVSGRLGFRVVAYGLGRHSWATDKLKKGMPDSMVAAALGQTGTATLHRHYAHLCEDARAIREAIDRADGRRAG